MNIKKRIYFMALLPAVLMLPAEAEAQASFSTYDIATGFKSYWPASVSASRLFSKQPEEMDHATGTATIRIPLYEIRTRDFTLPISLSYSTAAMPKEQLAGQVGAGWHLEAEPMVSREVRGMPDEFYLLRDKRQHQGGDENFRIRLALGEADVQEDIFHYRTLAGTSAFLPTEADDMQFLPRMLTHEPARISVDGGKVGWGFHCPIRLTDPSGYRYVFGGESSARELTFQGNYQCVTAWKASEITSPGGETIRFSYRDNAPDEYPYSRYDFYRIEDGPHADMVGDPGIPPHPGYWEGIDGKMNYYYLHGTETDTQGRTVPVFKKWDKADNVPYGSPGARVTPRPVRRIDFGDNSYVLFGYKSGLLERMEVYLGGMLERTVRLTYTDSRIPFLTRVEQFDANGGSLGHHFLGYDSPYIEGRDESSYNRMVGGMPTYGTQSLVPTQEVAFTDRDGNVYTTTIGAGGDFHLPRTRSERLSFVVYPSGGRTEYTYTSGSVFRPEGDPRRVQGGVRLLESITDYPVCGTPVRRSFKYGNTPGLYGTGFARYPVDESSFNEDYTLHYILRDTYGLYTPHSFRARLYTNQNLRGGDRRVYYPYVREDVDGVSTLYHFPCHSSFQKGVVPRYPDPIGKGTFISLPDSCMRQQGGRTFATRHYDGYSFGHATAGDLRMRSLFEGADGTDVRQAVWSTPTLRPLFAYAYTESTVDVMQREPGGASITEYSTDGGDVAVRTERRTYTADRLLRSVDTGRERMEYAYPSDTPGKAGHARMLQKNVCDTPVETLHYVDGVLRKRTVHDYQPMQGTRGGYALTALRESTGPAGTALRTMEEYAGHLLSGQPSQVTARDGSHTVIVWGYEGRHPLAIVEGTDHETVKWLLDGTDLFLVPYEPRLWEMVYEFLDEWRKQPADFRITTFRYDNAERLTARTGLDGRTETYEYDAAGRLSAVKDNQNQTVTTYEYHEANQ